MLARIARRALLISAVLAALALVVGGAGGLAAATGVVGGAALAIMSFLLLRRGTAHMAAPADPASPAVRTGLGLVLVRYALLALAAYVMVARLRLHPLGLIAGASSVALAITFEAFSYRR